MINYKRLLKSFRYALHGFIKTVKEEQNLKIQFFVAMLTVIVGFSVGLSRLEWLFLLFTITLVILMEFANSAVERITDILKPRLNVYVKEIKDISAAAVMLASLLAVIAGIIIFWPHFFQLFG